MVPRSVEQLRERLLAVHGPDTPFEVRDGADRGVDLVAELRFSDLKWRGLFMEVGLDVVYTIRIRLDEGRHEVRTRGKTHSIVWKNGQARRRSMFRDFGGIDTNDGTKWGEPYGIVKRASYRRVKGLTFEKLAEFSYRYQDLREPLERVVRASGWEWRHKTFGRL